MVDRVPAEEWRQFFDEAWRRYRDFFYVRNMHGYDWKAIGDRYRALLPHVAHRADLNYVLGEMVAELNVGHTYIQGGDYEIPAAPEGGAPRGALRARPGVRPLPHRAHPPGPQPGGPLPRARSPRWASTPASATTSSRSTASSCGATTTPTASSATRPTRSR